MSRPQNWRRVPAELASPWARMSVYEQFMAFRLLMQLDCHDGPVKGDLEGHVLRAMRGAVSGRERRRCREAVARIQAEGLLFERDGLIYLL